MGFNLTPFMRPEGQIRKLWAAVSLVVLVAVAVSSSAPAVGAADPTAPGAPTGLSGWWRNGEVSMSWEAPGNDGGAEITRYEYRFRAGGALLPDVWISTGTNTHVTVEGLTNGLAHSFEVRAANSAGVGVASAFEVMPLAPRDGDLQIVPESPDDPMPSYGPIEVYFDGKWGKVCDDNFYHSGHRGAAVACRQLGYTDGSIIESLNDSRLLPDHEYVMDEVVCDGCEERLADCEYDGDHHNCSGTEVVNVRCALTGFGPPRSVSFIPGTSQGTLVWNQPVSDAGSHVVRYEYRYRTANSNFGAWTDAGLNLMATVDNPPDGVAHRFEVRAENAAGAVSAVSVGAAAITGFTLIDADTGTELAALFGGDTISLPDGATRRLTIRANTSPAPESVVFNLSGQQSKERTENRKPWILHGDSHSGYKGEILMEGEYTLSATAYSGSGASGTVLDSLTVSFMKTDSEPVPPSAPRSPKAHRDDNGLTLSWEAPEDNGGAKVTAYQYRSRASGDATAEWTEWADVGQNRTVTLADGAAAVYEVRAANGVDRAGEALSLTVPSVSGVLASLQVERVEGSGDATLWWTAPLVNGGQLPTSYQYRFGKITAGSGPWDSDSWPEWTSAGGDLTATISGLDAQAEYAVEVRAHNDAGAGTATRSFTRAMVTRFRILYPPSGWLNSYTLNDGAVLTGWGSPNRRHYGFHAEAASGAPVGSMELELTGPISHRRVDNYPLYSLFAARWQDFAYGRYGLRATVYSGPDLSGTQLETFEIGFVASWPPPEAPGNLAARFDSGSITLSWTAPRDIAPSDISHYEYRSQAPGEEFTDWVDVGTGTSTVIPALEGAKRTYQVRAVTALNAGEAASVDTETLPGKPTNLSATYASGQLSLSWSTPNHNGGVTVDHQYRYRASDEPWSRWISVGADESVTVDVADADAAAVYFVEARAHTSVGAGPAAQASVADVYIFGVTLVDAERDVDLMLVYDGAFIVLDEFNTKEFNLRVDLIEGKQIGSMKFWHPSPWDNRTENTAPWTAFGEHENGDYYGKKLRAQAEPYGMTMQAYSGSDGSGTLLETAGISFTLARKPTQPLDLLANLDNGQLTLSWSTPSDDGGQSITGYQYRSRTPGGNAGAWIDLGANLSVSIDDVADGTAMIYDVSARNAAGRSLVASLETPSAPSEVRDLSLERDGTAATLAWTTPLYNGGEAPSSYQYRLRHPGNDDGEWIDAGSDLNETITGLDADSEYVFEVRAVNSGGSGPAALQSTAFVYEFTLYDTSSYADINKGPMRDGGIIRITPLSGFIFGIVAEVADDSLAGRVEFEMTGPNTKSSKENDAPWSLYGDGHLEDPSELWIYGHVFDAGFYQLTATAYGPGGADAEVLGSLSVNFSVIYERPSVPLNIAAHWEDGALTFTWDAPENSVDSVVTGYLYRWTPTGSSFGDYSPLPVTERSVTIPNVADGNLGIFDVRAVNPEGKGNSARVDLPQPPGVVRDLTAIRNGTQATLTWNSPAHNGGASITGYQFRSKAGSEEFGDWTDAGSDLSVIVSALGQSEHLFEVRATNSAHGPITLIKYGEATVVSAPDAGPLTGFNVVDTSSNPNGVAGTLSGSGTLALVNPANGTYNIHLGTDSNDDIHRVELQLIGAKKEKRTDYDSPYSLFGDNGEGLPAGSYTIEATAYRENGDVLGILTVSFTVTGIVALQQQGAPPNILATSEPTGPVAPGPLTGFTVVDAADTDQAVLWKHQTDGSKPEEGDTWKEWTDGGTLALGDPESGRYGIRVDTESGEGIHRVALELTLESTGEQRADRTDDAAPYSLYGDEGEGALHGESLPVGSYTLKATAYTEDGETLGSLEISFTVALAPPGKPQDLEGKATAQEIKLTWKVPTGSVVVEYVVYRGVLRNGSMNGQALSKYDTIEAAGAAMTYTDDNVEEGVEYRYRVAAVNTNGEGKKSNWLDITAE